MKPFPDDSQIPKPREINGNEKIPNFVNVLNHKIKELEQQKIDGYKERKKDFQDVIEWLQVGDDESREKLAQKFLMLFQNYLDSNSSLAKVKQMAHQKIKDNEQMRKENATIKQEMARYLEFSQNKDYDKLANDFKQKLIQEQQKFQQEKQRGQERLMQLEQTFKLQLQDLHKKSIQERKSKLFEENQILKEKLKGFLLEIDLQQKSFKSTLKRQHKEYELALAKSELHRQESSKAKEHYQETKQKLDNCIKTEQELRKQLSIYVEKFKQVEETLNKSNELFITFRKEMEQMANKTKKLELDNKNVRQLNENLQEQLKKETNQKKSLMGELDNLNEQIRKKEDLCRYLQDQLNKKK